MVFIRGHRELSKRAKLLSAVLLVGLVVCEETTGDRMSHLTAGTDNSVLENINSAVRTDSTS